MNKAIAQVFGFLVAVTHVLASGLIALFSIERFVGLENVPFVWLAKVMLLLSYIAVFGAVSVLLSINDHLRDITAKLNDKSFDGSVQPSQRRNGPELKCAKFSLM